MIEVKEKAPIEGLECKGLIEVDSIYSSDKFERVVIGGKPCLVYVGGK